MADPMTLTLPDDYYLNFCAKHLARTNREPRHTYGCACGGDDPRTSLSECWRLPLIDAHHDPADPDGSAGVNAVSFVYDARGRAAEPEVCVVGTFAGLHRNVPLRPVRFLGEPTGYQAVTVLVPKGQAHIYQFVADGVPELDPVNVQRVALDNGRVWSRFFTDGCTATLMFERWECRLLERLTAHVLPFRTRDGELFLKTFFDPGTRRPGAGAAPAHRIDQAVGVVNFIDKVVAREERHHYTDYRLALSIVRDVLRSRFPGTDPADAPRAAFVALYDQMGRGDVPGWDYEKYHDPRYFLQLLRRHTITGAFAHPRYGGNTLAAGWAFLEDRYRDAAGDTLFDWRRAVESPLGANPDYRG